MPTMIQQYQCAKREHDYCAAWAALIGKKYNGGGGGIGELKSLRLMSGEDAPTVYHQYSDGAKNYHTKLGRQAERLIQRLTEWAG